MPDTMLDELSKFDARHAKLEDYLSSDYKHLKAPARVMLYTAIWISWADGYSPEERAMAARAAKLLGVDDDLLAALETAAEIEVTAAAGGGAAVVSDPRAGREATSRVRRPPQSAPERLS